MRLPDHERSLRGALMESNNASLPKSPIPHIADTPNSYQNFVPPLDVLSGVLLLLRTNSPTNFPRNPCWHLRVCREAKVSTVDVRDREDDPRLPVLEIRLDLTSPMVLNLREKRPPGLRSRMSEEESRGSFDHVVGLEIR